MRALLDQHTVPQDKDLVCLRRCPQAVRDRDNSAPLAKARQGGIDGSLCAGVQRRSGFVEHQDRRIAHDSAGDGDALALAAG